MYTTAKTQRAALLSSLALAVCMASVQAQGMPPSADQVNSGSAQRYFDIPAQPLDQALMALAQQAGLGILLGNLAITEQTSHVLRGNYQLDEALQQLLAGSGLGYRLIEQAGKPQLQIISGAPSQSSIQLSPITIEGAQGNSRDGEWAYQAPRSVSVISREQMDKRPPRHAADMLAGTPGVSSAVNRHNPGLSVNIRGMQDFGRVNMMIDGMRQNHVESGHQQRNGEMYVDSELLSSVVIEKGPNAGVYGANAIAGSANFRTLDYDDVILPGQDHGLRLRGSTGIGGYANGVNFLGSAAVAGRINDRLELLVARSQKNLGEYNIGNRGRSSSTYSPIEEMSYSDQQQDSLLSKARLNLSDDQRLQLTYTGTVISYNNTSSSAYIGNGYTRYGSAEAKNKSYSIDYEFSPDNPLIDLRIKTYFVSTQNERINNPTGDALADTYWNNNLCLNTTLDNFTKDTCLSGMRSTSTSRTDTWGLQLENTSYFQTSFTQNAELFANYGFEWFQDQGKSGNKSDRNGVTSPFLASQTSGNLNPNGRRDVASAFASLTFSQDPFTLKAGLRYDWYNLRGKTTVPGVKSSYISRLESFTNYYCSLTPAWARNGCAIGRAGDEAGARAWMTSRNGDYDTNPNISPRWIDAPTRYEYDVDRSMGRFSPFLSAAYKPLDWLELFANWGKGFRPPAMTETLWEGDHGSGSSSSMYPNPLLDSERTTSWELGLNILRQDLFRQDDRLTAKLAYFNTKAERYMFASINNTLPGDIPGLGLGKVFFQNNQMNTRFRGLELESSYDAGAWYTGINYTKYLSGENDFCTKVFPVGSKSSRWDQPNEDGSMTTQHLQALAEGYGSFQEKMDAMSYCGADVVLNSVVARPMDKHGITAGIRLFQQALDIGLRYSRNEGYTPKHDLAGRELWDSYTTWDMYAAFRPTENITFNLAVENIRDENYLTDFSDMFSRTYSPGRTVQAGMEIRF